MLSNHLILCHLPLLWPSVFPCIRVFSKEKVSALHIRWPKYWSFSLSISSSSEYSGLISFRIDGFDLIAVQETSPIAQRVKNSLAVQETQEPWLDFWARKDALEEEMANCSSIPAWKIPWTELQRVGHN